MAGLGSAARYATDRTRHEAQVHARRALVRYGSNYGIGSPPKLMRMRGLAIHAADKIHRLTMIIDAVIPFLSLQIVLR